MTLSRFAARAAGALVLTPVAFFVGVVASGSAQAWDVTVWDRVAACESSGNWAVNTGNGYYGGVQFSASTWREFGGNAYAPQAHQATKEQQIAIARRVLAVQGVKAWPVCGYRAGLTQANGGADRNALPLGGGAPAPATEPPATTGRLTVDGIIGPATTRALQKWVGVVPNGTWGRETTRALQVKVGAKVDGVRGPETTRKVQSVVGATPDGVWGSGTTRALQRYLNERP